MRKLLAFSTLSTLLLAGAANALSLTVVGAECDPSNGNIPGVALIALTCGAGDRTNSANVNLGAADGKFYSLGLSADSTTSEGGIIAFRIDPGFTGPVAVVEVTGAGNHYEAAEIYVGTTDNFNDATKIGTVTNGGPDASSAVNTVSFTGSYNYLFLADISKIVYPSTGSQDGYDLDSITVTAVPLPAGVLLLGSALAGLGLARRRA